MKPTYWLIIACLLTPSIVAAQHVEGSPAADTMDHAAHEMTDPLDIPQTRTGSGTSWLPDLSPMHALHRRAGDWSLMLHGNAFLQYISLGSDRGKDQFGSINWVMGMAQRPLLGGELGLRAMLSAEPWTISGCGYPILLASGELCDGSPIVDEQHPHDLFMELAAEYRRPITDDMAIQLYAAPAGEPALGPVAFPHRVSAMLNPLAPISHHWFDATHIAFGVATAGVYGREWKVEGSLFNGREPDEERTNIDLAPLDSYSGRFWWLPNERWALQVSGAQLNEAEPGHEVGDPRVDVKRYTASATHHRPVSGGGTWATTAAFGRNEEEGTGTNAALIESSVSLTEHDQFFGRAEWTEKAGHDLDLDHALEEEVFSVGQLSLGYVRQFGSVSGLMPGIGVQGSVSFLPEDLEPSYGENNPLGFTIFASLHPAPMPMGMPMGPAPVPMQGHEGMQHDTMQAGEPGAPPMDHAAMGHEVPGATAAGQAGMHHGEMPAMMDTQHIQKMHEMHVRMMEDPVIRERVRTDPELSRMMQEMEDMMPPGHSMQGANGGAVDASDREQASDFIVRLLSDPAVEARIHSDPQLHQLWSDPDVQRRLAELKQNAPESMQREPAHPH